MAESAARRQLLLVVDDDVRSARVLAQLLREDGYEVEVATDGACAIGRLARLPAPDTLVTDLRMPHAGGVEVIRFARGRFPAMPIFIITGYPELLADLGDDCSPRPVVFSKPLPYNDFTRALRQPALDGAPEDGTHHSRP